jgi:hypothetical protein
MSKTTNFEISKKLARKNKKGELYSKYKILALKNGIARKTFEERVRRGLSLEDAAKRPLFQPENIIGMRFGKLLILKYCGKDKWYCVCDCGNKSLVFKHMLKSGKTISCGCHRKTCSITHGESKTPLHNIWQGIKQRCLDQKSKNYLKYGARGIKICDRWKENYKNFVADMGHPPTNKHSIERINNDGDYEPNNCRWATASEQSRNRRSNVKITFNNETKILIEWCEYLKLPYKTICSRIRTGWTPEKAFTTTIKNKLCKKK